jgi:urocanate hydratase
MADNHIDFKYSSYVQDIWLWVWSFPLGLCFRKTGDLQNRYHRLPVLEEMAKTAPIEIQQQMQDNIQWIKCIGGSQARILYADAEGRVKIASAFNQAIAKGYWNHCFRTRPSRCFRNRLSLQGDIKHLRRIAFYSRYGYSKRDWRQFPWRYLGIHSQWRRSRMGEVINGGFGILMDLKKR